MRHASGIAMPGSVPAKRTTPGGFRERGAIALEYILIAALVAIAIIATFQLWGRAVATAVGEAVTDSHGALEAP